MAHESAVARSLDELTDPGDEFLDRAFFALSDPVRRAILQRLDSGARLVSELAAPFDISLQAVSRHIQVLVRAGLVRQERTGRISRCSLDVGPIFAAAVWINRYSKYWQQQFDLLAVALGEIERERSTKPRPASRRKGRSRIRASRP
ncbi:MAG TPA: metalloregulator ArsR/SmtB family transcription factor [Myxococcota bacterium]|nr:metalloregulator ArsR/SmtB family transcription factor [Myxococcota bacterium]